MTLVKFEEYINAIDEHTIQSQERIRAEREAEFDTLVYGRPIAAEQKEVFAAIERQARHRSRMIAVSFWLVMIVAIAGAWYAFGGSVIDTLSAVLPEDITSGQVFDQLAKTVR